MEDFSDTFMNNSSSKSGRSFMSAESGIVQQGFDSSVPAMGTSGKTRFYTDRSFDESLASVSGTDRGCLRSSLSAGLYTDTGLDNSLTRVRGSEGGAIESSLSTVTRSGERGEIKSVVRVKDPTLHFLPAIDMLQPLTDLNEPPANWLRRQPSLVQQKTREFAFHRANPHISSIGMANNSLDIAGEVDVISPAKNIKKLLKMPYSGSHLSMMVHRIGKTLLIDEFDVHKNLLRQQSDDWKWLREFYYESIKKDMQMKCVPKKNKTRDHLQDKNMFSKFLYRSILAAQNSEAQNFPISPVNEKLSVVPEPIPMPEQEGHHREVVWTFENLKMLIGIDLPIFNKGANYPCVSLKLRDMETPINVLTGLDYWLDNLMCNVPEVAMCFHVNGIVQKYELIKTDDIPNIKDSEFDPHMVTDIARNILSFLKSNATKEGHTYWLYKGADEDVVKLYDLTSLADTEDDQQSNPFTVPLGMLLYRVARNMRQQNQRKKKQKIQILLENCLLLLDDEKYSQVCTSARYLLSDLYVPDAVVREDWTESEDSESDEDEDRGQESDEMAKKHSTTVKVKVLCKQNGYRRHHVTQQQKPVRQAVNERCMTATDHIVKGLLCLDKDFTTQIRKQKNIVEEQARCNSSEPIALSYEPLQKSAPPHDDKESPLHDKDHFRLVETESSHIWHRLSKVLLLRKAAMSFYTLAKGAFASCQAAESLKLIRLALQCFAGMRILLPKKANENKELLCGILGLAGDIILMSIHRNLKKEELEEMTNYSESELGLLESVQRELGDNFEYEWVFDLQFGDVETGLRHCCHCYRRGLDMLSSSQEQKAAIYVLLRKRIANAKNELGVWCMNQAQICLQKDDPPYPSSKMEKYCQKAEATLDEGVTIFESEGDKANIAFLYSNKGRLMRLLAQAHTQNTMLKDQPQFSALERKYYKKAIEYYTRALEKVRGHFPEIWESVCWDLSTTLFNMACLIQDNAPLVEFSLQEVEKEVIDLMRKALKYCNVDLTSAKQPMCQYRAATINHRLASLYHNSLRNQQHSEQKKKYLRQMMESHYKKCEGYFSALECHLELLRVHLEQVAFHEFILSSQSNAKQKMKTLKYASLCLLECGKVLHHIIKQLDDPDFSEKLHTEGASLTSILESRLQFVLLQLIKCFSTLKQSKPSDDLNRIKTLYRENLGNSKGKAKSLSDRWNDLLKNLEELKVLQHEVILHEPDVT